MALTPAIRRRALVFLLRLGGVVTFSAFFTMLLPVAWMAEAHEALGMGPFPRSAVVDYLARSIAALYGFHGCLMLLVSTDPVRYRPIVTFLSVLNIVFGLMLVAIDLHAGMPMFWTLVEGPSIVMMGLALGYVNRQES